MTLSSSLEAVQLLQQRNNSPLSAPFELLSLGSAKPLFHLTCSWLFLDLIINICHLRETAQFGNAQFDLKTAAFH